MKILKLKNPLSFSVIPRKFPLQSDSIVLSLRREISDEVLTPSFTFEVGEKLKITITEAVDYFKPDSKFEVKITNNSEIIYLGKLQTLLETAEIQNYEYKQKQSKKFGFK